MTDAEALTLKPGDRVEYQLLSGPNRGKWVEARVDHLADWYTPPRVYVDVPETLKHVVKRLRMAMNVRRSLRPSSDPITANVFADWLEEHGYPEAATALRQAFPLADGKPLPG